VRQNALYFLNSYLHAYVDKTKEELESRWYNSMIALPKVLPKYVIDGLKVRLKSKIN
jgi:hypothetical protein